MLDKSEKMIDPSGAAAYKPKSEAMPMNLSTLPPAVIFPRLPFLAIRPGEGVKNIVKPAQFKIGLVKITEHWTPAKGRSYHELRYIDRTAGRKSSGG